MKRALFILCAIAALIVIAALSAPFFISADAYKRVIADRLSAATGHAATISGAAHLRLFPNPAIRLEQVTLANAPGFSSSNFAETASIDAEVALAPLLHGRVIVKDFVLEKPVLNLEVNAAGKKDWKIPRAQNANSSGASASGANAMLLGHMQIKDGTLRYRDDRSGKAYEASALDADLNIAAGGATLNGSLIWNKQNVTFALSAASPEALINGGDSAVKTAIDSGDLFHFAFNGTAENQSAKGHAEFSTASMDALSQWAGGAANPALALPFSAKGELSCMKGQCAITGGTFTLGKVQATGDAALHWALQPTVSATLAFPSLYGGSGKLDGNVNLTDKKFETTISGNGMEAEPLLKNLAHFDRLTGTLTMDAHVTGAGADEAQILSSLSGNGHVKVVNGAIRGIDLNQVVKSAQAILTGAGTAGQQTAFSELSGSFTVRQGVVQNKDLMLKAAGMNVSGAGTVDLPHHTVHYRLTPALTGNEKGLSVPVNVDGDFSHLSFRPDLAAAAQSALNHPDQAKAAFKDLKSQWKKDNGKQLLQNLKNNPGRLQNLLNGLGR